MGVDRVTTAAYYSDMINATFKVVVEEVAEEDLLALKESISDHILQEFPDTEVRVTEEGREES
jgi:hypothetical protein